jgi:hypothetical protein
LLKGPLPFRMLHQPDTKTPAFRARRERAFFEVCFGRGNSTPAFGEVKRFPEYLMQLNPDLHHRTTWQMNAYLGPVRREEKLRFRGTEPGLFCWHEDVQELKWVTAEQLVAHI